MSVTALIGLQWGDEGKGKIVDALSGSMDVVVRAQGGANAGHTVQVGGKTRVLHLIPSGMLYGHVTGVIGNGVVVDPFTLLEEIAELRASGFEVQDRLRISDRAHVVMPYHAEMDKAQEEGRGAAAIGTTRRGIGPAYMDKAARTGLTMGDLLDRRTARESVVREVKSKNRWLEVLGRPPLDAATVAERVLGAVAQLEGCVTDTVALLNDAAEAGREILIEGAQGALLDVDLGTYPYVTSSNCHIGGLLSGSGLPAGAVKRVIGVAKAYCTRVGGGPFPTEDSGQVGDALREKGREFGATTGRPRRCGWFDAVAARHAVRTNGVTEIALTKSDVLSGQPVLRLGTAYRIGGQQVRDFPAVRLLEGATPEWRDFAGFDEDLAGATSFDRLPPSLRDLVISNEMACGAPVSLVSTGPGREQMFPR
jgi:adenylosuccinate synthase